MLAGFLITLGLTLVLASCDESISEKAEVTERAPEGITLASGSFEGRSDHVVTGGVTIVESGGTFFVNLAEDFSLDEAPAPRVGLGMDGYKKETSAGALKGKTGASSYELPAGVNPKDFNEVYIWCDKFDVPLGVAKLSSE